MTISNERIAEMLMCCDKAEEGPWSVVYADEARIESANGNMIIYDEGGHSIEDAQHISNCDPDTIRELLTEILTWRATL